jgi:hypothetical protein
MNNEEKLKKLIEWATGDDRGTSSVALLRHMMGFEPKSFDWTGPCDEDDRGRCIRLLNLIPEWWERLEEMANVSEYWAEQIPLIRAEAKYKNHV